MNDDLKLIEDARAHGYEYPSIPCAQCGEPTYFVPGDMPQDSGHYVYHDHDDTPTLETFRDWYGNGDVGEMASDGMGNGACMYTLDNGQMWVFQWDDQGFERCGQVTAEEWAELEASYMPTISEYDAEQQYMELLGEIYDTVDICGHTFDAGRALKELDPIAFREGMLSYFDQEGIEIS